MTNHFFPMSRGDFCFIVALLSLAVISFLPWTRNMQWAGMSMLGWMMALLMVLSPSVALLRVIRDRKQSAIVSEEAEE